MFRKKSSAAIASSPLLGRRSAPGGGAPAQLDTKLQDRRQSRHLADQQAQQAQQPQPQQQQQPSNGDTGQNGLAIDKRSLTKLRKQLQRMSTDELEMFASTGDNFVLDCLVDRTHAIRRVQQERDDLKKQVSTLAKFNYAREPEFVRDRTKLRELSDEVAGLIRHATRRHVEPSVSRLNTVLARLTNDAIKYEELSESMAQDFLLGKTCYDEFIDQYVNLRKETSKKRISVDKLTKEKASLDANHIAAKLSTAGPFTDSDSPVPTPRQRKRVSFNK